MQMDDVTAVDLPKWPAMTVQGESVTKEQAAEIILRTNHWWATCNDRVWLATVWDALGVKHEPGEPQAFDFKSLEECVATLDPVAVEYLNNSRVMSSWIGGAHGWCDWEGRIFSANYNIGKWPSVKGVLDEWRAIAKAFPYLKLRCQLWSRETSEEDNTPLVEYVVENGTATACAPTLAILVTPDSRSIWEGPNSVADWSRFRARERGCDEVTLRRAIRQVQRQAKERLYAQTVDRLAADLAEDINKEILSELQKAGRPYHRPARPNGQNLPRGKK